ncbi:MAG: carbohydrate-binding family 9-like protein [Prolixibacteraceae bacterium]|jgi:hypothetical protein|nr:carbohydrate-binding family 9-like protein [Prolixibacteraceae bacterium]
MESATSQKLTIPYIGDVLLPDNQEIVDRIKRDGISVDIDKINWLEYSFKPIVKLYAGFSEEYLWLSYEVKGDYFRAKALADQESVWQDSCVEFFIFAGGDKGFDNWLGAIYRNFEFNVLGVCLSAVGTKSKRASLSPSEMNQILRFPSIDRNNLPSEGDCFDWNMSVAIPLKLLGIGQGSKFRANFYKCGDLTAHPHFLSWNSINVTIPDFHLPQFFGEVELGKR